MWIPPSIRIGIAVVAASTVCLTPWMSRNVNEAAAPNPQPLSSVRTQLSNFAEPSQAPPETSHVFAFRAEPDAALTGWALARFDRAGLQLPPLIIAFHADKQLCSGHYGFYRSGNPARIDICGFNRNRFLLKPKQTILHELAHAWAQHTLTDETREEFLSFRGLRTWGNDQTPWEERGTEHAAEIIAWALMDQELYLTTIRTADVRTLAQGYELLTEAQPPTWGRTLETGKQFRGSVDQR